ncbi:MAG: hypothetical protein RQ982_06060 [Gammaproteobacteria bacterium]|nr:hypothetical protein [Gammaproteobacteria bacterium]
MRTLLIIFPVITVLIISDVQAAAPVIVKTPELEIELFPRTAQQMDSFYEARGFPKAMRDILKKQCFITVGIHNTSNKKIWLDLSNWKFSSAGKAINRQHRDVWKKRWQDMNMPLNKQSTFRWTLIPETLDYLPGEDEGGNIVLPFTDKPVSLTATFATGEDKQGEAITITTDKLFCAEDAK